MMLARRSFCALFVFACCLSEAQAGTAIPLTVNLSESVTVTGTPRVAVDVGGQTRYATYTSGSGTNALTFTLLPQAGDVDLDGIMVSSPIDLNGGTMKDAAGNNAILTFTPPNTSGIKVNYPSLGMDFVYDADGRYSLNGTVYNDLTSFLAASGGTFTRASIGTYYDSSGTLQTAASGTPRFDWNPVTHAAKGLLIEESRTNLLTYSTAMDNAVWGFAGGTKTTGGTAPDGSISATYFSGPVAATTASRGSITATSTSLTYSVYAKYVSGSGVRNFLLRNQTTATNFNSCNFNLQTGVVSSGCVGWTFTSLPNGWYRLIYTQTTGITVGDTMAVYFGDTGAALTASDSWLAWGAQLEAGSYPTSYIPTTSAAVTRAADVFSIPTAGWFNAAETTLVASAQVFGKASGGRFQFGLGVNGSNYLGFPYVDSLSFLSSAYYRAAGAGPVIDPPDLSFYTLYKAGYAFSTTAGTSSYSLNGVLSGTGSGVAAMSGTPTLTLGYAPFNLNQASGYIERLKYYPARVSDAQLQLLTQ